MGLTCRAVLALVGLVSATTNIIIESTSGDETAHEPLVLSIVAALALFLDNAQTAWIRYREPEKRVNVNRVNMTLYGALKAVSQLPNAPELDAMGVSIWRVRQLPLGGKVNLRRALRYRLTATPQPTEVKWTSGKGVIGKAVRERVPAYADWRSLNKRYFGTNGSKLKEETFRKLPQEQRLGLTYGEFQAFLGKYAEVLAVPVVSESGSPIGCISLDVCVSRASSNPFLDSQKVRDVIDGTAALIRDDVEKLT